MPSPRTKTELRAYLSLLYMCLEREQTNEPTTVAELRQEIGEMKDRCAQCGVDIPPFEQTTVEWFGV